MHYLLSSLIHPFIISHASLDQSTQVTQRIVIQKNDVTRARYTLYTLNKCSVPLTASPDAEAGASNQQ